MTAQRDIQLSYRNALETASRDLRDAASKLDGAPVWQRPPQGSELTGSAAVTASELANQSRRGQLTRSAIRALQTDLDVVDLAPLDAAGLAAAEQAARAWLNGVTSADALLAELLPDPRRRFRDPDSPELTATTATRIIAERELLGGAIGGLGALQVAIGLSALDVEDLLRTGRLLADAIPAQQSVGVLLPLRIETRFDRPAGVGTDWRLRLRVYPEVASFDRHPGPPTAAEWQHTLDMWQASDGSLETPEGHLAFQRLAEQHGGPRAAWLASTLPPRRSTPDGPISIPNVPLRVEGERVFQRPMGLPPRLEVWLGRAGKPPERKEVMIVDSARIAAESGVPARDAAGVPVAWWLSFKQALQVGLAAEINLGPDTPPDIEVLYVIGLGDDPAGPLFAAHRAAGTLAVIPPGTPSNTVGGAAAADLGRHPDVWRQMVAQTGLSQPATRELEVALTGNTASLAPLPSGDVDVRGPAERLVGALWPVLWGRALKDFLGLGLATWELGWWAGRCLAPEGPFPAIRIVDQPFGVLPVSALARWKVHTADPPIESRMVGPLRLLLRRAARAAETDGTVVGADTRRFIDLLARTPTQDWGWGLALPHELVPLAALGPGVPVLAAALRAEFDRDVVRDLQYLFGLAPRRRYRGIQGAHRISPELLRSVDPRVMLGDARQHWPSSRPPMRRMLEAEVATEGLLPRVPDPQWWGLQGQEDEHPVPFLARLVRHSLVITRAEVLRVRANPNAPAELTLPIDHARDLLLEPGLMSPGLLEDVAGKGPVGAAVARGWWTVRDAVRALDEVPPARLDQALLSVLDAASHRIDPWVTGLATRRLRWLAAHRTRFRLGAFGWVDAPRPYDHRLPGTSVRAQGPTSGGLLHAPSARQVTAAALLRELAVRAEDTHRWDIALDSASIRIAARLAADVRSGIHLMEALGREVERIAGDPALVMLLRRHYPMRPEHAGRRVCDGEKVLAAARAKPVQLVPPLDALADAFAPVQDVLDTYGDLLVLDGVHDLVSGQPERAAEAMEAAAALGAPPTLRVLHADRGGRSVTTTVMAALPGTAAPPGATPGTLADPSFAAFLVESLGAAPTWTWRVGDAEVTLAQLGLQPVDTLSVPLAVLEQRVRAIAGELASIDGGTAAGRIAEARRLAGLLGGEGGLPDFLVSESTAAAAELSARLDTLRTAAELLVAQLRAPDGAAALGEVRRWAITPALDLPNDERARDAADLLDARVVAARQAALAAAGPLTDPMSAHMRVADLRAAVRALAVGGGLLPVLPLVSQAGLAGLAPVAPGPGGRPAIDPVWLEVVAAVRPGLARLDAHQLRGQPIWAAWSSHPADPWCTAIAEPAPPPDGNQHRVRIVYGPAGVLQGAGQLALAPIDHWGETIPSRQQITGAAFGFNAPKSRAPQCILLAVPPEVGAPLDTPTLVDILAEARELTRARMATPASLAEVGPILPLPLLLGDSPLASNSTGTDLEKVKP